MSDPLPSTKIIATVGPASSSAEMLNRLIEAGVSIFRLNFSHGDLADLAEVVTRIRAAAKAQGRPIAIMGDLPGPKIRVGPVDEGINVETGDLVSFVPQKVKACKVHGKVQFGCTYEGIACDVEPGQRLLVNDGAVRMLVVEVEGDVVRCTVTYGGLITSGKGINLPDSKLTVPSLTKRDWELMKWAVEHDLDLLAQSFVRTAAEVFELNIGINREAHRQGKPEMRIPVVAKIEKPEAVENIDAIVRQAGGVMVARGDLGVEMDLAHVPVIQRRIIKAARANGTPCIVATQMLETMIENPQPTRAEASDVGNAIFADVDAVMLSGETAVGKYPVLAVETMRRIALHTETHNASEHLVPDTSPSASLLNVQDRLTALAMGVSAVVRGYGARFIVVWSQSGASARALSQTILRIPIIAVSSDHRTVRQMILLRGVLPFHMPVPESLGEFTTSIDALLIERGLAASGDRGVQVAGWPIGPDMVTNTLAMHEVGDPIGGFAFHT